MVVEAGPCAPPAPAPAPGAVEGRWRRRRFGFGPWHHRRAFLGRCGLHHRRPRHPVGLQGDQQIADTVGTLGQIAGAGSFLRGLAVERAGAGLAVLDQLRQTQALAFQHGAGGVDPAALTLGLGAGLCQFLKRLAQRHGLGLDHRQCGAHQDAGMDRRRGRAVAGDHRLGRLAAQADQSLGQPAQMLALHGEGGFLRRDFGFEAGERIALFGQSRFLALHCGGGFPRLQTQRFGFGAGIGGAAFQFGTARAGLVAGAFGCLQIPAAGRIVGGLGARHHRQTHGATADQDRQAECHRGRAAAVAAPGHRLRRRRHGGRLAPP
ncbi:hypothetical protein ACFQ4K_18135 [Tistrella bauzanensis]